MAPFIIRFIFPLLLCLTPIAGAKDANGRYTEVDCPDVIQAAAGAHLNRISCGRLLLPENRQTQENGRLVELFVLRLQAEAEAGNAPILHLAGGPGDAASAELSLWLESSLQRDFDIILVDQRGTGFSLPSLDCPEYSEPAGGEWARACRKRLEAQGVDLSRYHYQSVVWDFHDLLLALELDEVNLYGQSYGSRLALLLAKLAPERIRAMVLDGVYPPPKSDLEEFAYNAERSLERLFADCQADAACDALYPDLRVMFYRVVDEMNAAPPELYHLGESTGRAMSGDQFLAWTIEALRHKDALPILPALIAGFDAGGFDMFVLINAFVQAPHWNDGDFHSEGFELSLRCSEGAALAASQGAIGDRLDVSNAVSRVVEPLLQHIRDLCVIWKVPAAPEMIAQTASSDVPALLLSGAFDSATPPRWADFAAARLSRSWQFVFPNVGHGVLYSAACATELTRAFLDHPLQAPAADCFARLRPPAFVEQEFDEA